MNPHHPLPQTVDAEPECARIRERYARRRTIPPDRYAPTTPDVLLSRQERTAAIARCLQAAGLVPLDQRRLLEIGCGSGANLLMFLQLGFRPENLVGNDLIEDRVAAARALLPPTVSLLPGDACALPLADESFDVVFQSTVFTSVLDDAMRRALAARMWRLARSGGGVLWYDFAYNNPRNPDVRGVPLREITALFPNGRLHATRITLAPPLARPVARLHPFLHAVLNLIPQLRTHWLCWIEK